MYKTVIIKKEVLERITKFCKLSLTTFKDEDKVTNIQEVCGILIGKFDKNRVLVDEVVKTENMAKSRFFFEISPEELYNAYIYAQKKGREVVGIFHSHPHGSSSPSRLDVRGIKETGLVWVIVGNNIRAFLYNSSLDKIIELMIEVK